MKGDVGGCQLLQHPARHTGDGSVDKGMMHGALEQTDKQAVGEIWKRRCLFNIRIGQPVKAGERGTNLAIDIS